MYGVVLLFCAASLLDSAHGCMCHMMYQPVCGDDGVTYGNLCTFHCQNLLNLIGGLEEVGLRCAGACDGPECAGSQEAIDYNKKFVVAPKYFATKNLLRVF